MSEKEILESNKLISEFMDLEIISDGISWFDTNYRPLGSYHSSWEWLMPVVEKIEKEYKHEVHIYAHYNWKNPNRCTILTWKDDVIIYTSSKSKIECVYEAVIEFIKLHNANDKG